MNDAVNKQPTLAEEMSRMQGFAVRDGETSDGAPTAEENAVLAANSRPAIAADDDKGTEADEDDTDADESAEDEDAKAAADQDQQPAGKQKPQRSAQKRIDKAVERQRTAERTLDQERGRYAAESAALQKRLDDIEARLTSGKAPANTADAPDPSKYEAGELDPKYIRDLARAEASSAVGEVRKEYEARETKAKEATAKQEWDQKYGAFQTAGAGLHDDFKEVVVEGAERGEWPLSAHLAQLIMDSPEGPAVAYHLASNVEEAKKVAAMSPLGQAAHFGRLAAKFSSPSSDAPANPAKTTKAPPPLSGRARGAGGNREASPATTDFRQFEQLAQQKRRG
jgi:hypothetical protein